MSTISDFWNWFKENNHSYLFIDEVDEGIKEDLLEKLLDQLHLYCDHLYFELGGTPGEEQELIITAEGDIDYFVKVESLVSEAPIIKNWTFIAFIPRREADNTLNFEDVELKPAEMWFMPLNSAAKPNDIGIRVCSPNYELIKDSKWLRPAIYKCLDILLGEKTFALDIDFIDTGEVPDQPEEQGMIQLADLPAFVIWKKKQLNR
ncbi:MAG: hypothetical protein ACHQF4_11280 [Sphingobacteriales bacterium]